MKAKARARLKYLARHPSHALFHPHQRLWNLYLTPVAKRLFLRKPLILADSLLLWGEVVGRRAARLGARRVFARARASRSKLLIFDVGQHKDPKQILAAVEWFGKDTQLEIHAFEAHPEYWEIAKARLAALPNVRIENLALVGPDFDQDHIRLYLAGGRGVGDSIYAKRSDDHIDVPAYRLSRYITDNKIDLRDRTVILRMNIEGAEMGVLQDLAAAGILPHFDGFFGSWDDMYKTDPKDDETFRAFLRAHRIRSIPFNDRDLGAGAVFGLRKRAIAYAIRTCLLAGEKAK